MMTMPRTRRAVSATFFHAALVVAAGGGSGCLDDLPSPSLVDDLRVLAVRAEPPQVEPGATVALDALVFDPEGRPVRYQWYACIVVDQGQGFFGGGAETATSGGDGTPLSNDPYGGSCERRVAAGERWAMALGDAATATLTVPADLFDDDDALKTAYALPEELEIPAAVKASFLGIAGVNYTVSLVTEVDGRRIETHKRVNVSLPSGSADNAVNANPSDLAFHIAGKDDDAPSPPSDDVEAPPDGRCFIGAPPALTAGERYRLTPLNIPDPQPKYTVLLAGTTTDEAFEVQTVEETSFYSWFSTRGSISKPISKAPGQPQNDWKLGAGDAGPVHFWVVARDGRGGVAWCHESLLVGPAAPTTGGP